MTAPGRRSRPRRSAGRSLVEAWSRLLPVHRDALTWLGPVALRAPCTLRAGQENPQARELRRSPVGLRARCGRRGSSDEGRTAFASVVRWPSWSAASCTSTCTSGAIAAPGRCLPYGRSILLNAIISGIVAVAVATRSEWFIRAAGIAVPVATLAAFTSPRTHPQRAHVPRVPRPGSGPVATSRAGAGPETRRDRAARATFVPRLPTGTPRPAFAWSPSRVSGGPPVHRLRVVTWARHVRDDGGRWCAEGLGRDRRLRVHATGTHGCAGNDRDVDERRHRTRTASLPPTSRSPAGRSGTGRASRSRSTRPANTPTCAASIPRCPAPSPSRPDPRAAGTTGKRQPLIAERTSRPGPPGDPFVDRGVLDPRRRVVAVHGLLDDPAPSVDHLLRR